MPATYEHVHCEYINGDSKHIKESGGFLKTILYGFVYAEYLCVFRTIFFQEQYLTMYEYMYSKTSPSFGLVFFKL